MKQHITKDNLGLDPKPHLALILYEVNKEKSLDVEEEEFNEDEVDNKDEINVIISKRISQSTTKNLNLGINASAPLVQEKQ